MRILIVSGYSVTENGKIQFDKYCDIIRRVFLNQKHLLDTETEFFTRDVSNLDDFLFDADCGYQSGDAARLFDFLDFIFIEMDASLRPWSKFSQKIMVLIRMCLRTNKILLASSGAMQALVFFVATNLETPVDVINGNQGCPLGDMTKIQKSVDQIKRNEYFLDNVTGDLYGIHFDQEQFKNCWVPIANGGIHYKKAAEEYNIVGKYMLKAPIYKPQGIKEIYGIFTSSQDEEILTIKKNRIQHPLFRDVKAEFLVHSKHSWDIHPFNVLNPRKVFEILAESPRGPQIIQVNHNIIGVQFTINPKYPETLILLRNFIVEHLIEIRSLLNKPQSIIVANNELRKNKLDLENLTQQQTELQNKGEKSKINFEVLTKFRHVGFAGKKNSKLEIVKNNAINDNGKLNQAMQTMKAKNSPRQNTENDQLSSQKSGLARLTTRLQEEQKTTDKFQKTAAEIRQMLHPNINDEGIPPDEPLWVPGNMSEHLKSRSVTKQPDQQQSIARSVRPMTSQSRTFKLTRVSTAKSRVQPVVPGYDECRNKPIVRCSSPYITPLERDRQEERDADSKIIGPKTIRTSVVSTIRQLPPHHLYQNPYVSPGDFQFREIKKDKWLAEQNFILS